MPALPLQTAGLGPPRAIIDFLQDEGPGTDFGFAGWCRREAPVLGVHEQLLVGLMREIGQPTSIASSQARFRVRHLIIDEDKLASFCHRLAEIARAHGVSTTPLAIRQAVARLRLRADRGWRGQTDTDPLPVLHDVPPI